MKKVIPRTASQSLLTVKKEISLRLSYNYIIAWVTLINHTYTTILQVTMTLKDHEKNETRWKKKPGRPVKNTKKSKNDMIMTLTSTILCNRFNLYYWCEHLSYNSICVLQKTNKQTHERFVFYNIKNLSISLPSPLIIHKKTVITPLVLLTCIIKVFILAKNRSAMCKNIYFSLL